jgi:hypothetical protein
MPPVKVRSWLSRQAFTECRMPRKVRQRHKRNKLSRIQTDARNQTAGQGTSILSIFLPSFIQGSYKKAWKSSTYGDPLADAHMKGVTNFPCFNRDLHVNGTCSVAGRKFY